MNPTIDVLLSADDLAAGLRADVRSGLSEPTGRRTLPPKWFYDERGSQLFDDITRLSEYYPTRCERAILEAHAHDIMGPDVATLIELGSGTSDKTRLLLDAGIGAQSAQGAQGAQGGRGAARSNRGLRTFVPFDVSEETLRGAADALASRYRPAGLAVHAIVGDFEHHLGVLKEIGPPGQRLVAFLGGTIGNFDPSGRASFLSQLAAALAPGDRLLLGTDLVKDPARLVLAYDDPAGVTAAFNRNVLSVINRQLGADFDPDSFDHLAVWSDAEEWIEMRLRSRREQTVTVSDLALEVRFDAGEEMRTEISAKFRPARVCDELAAAGFDLAQWWTDPDGDFGLSLSRRLG
ncbi:MAG: L-histidine Nalpha-methyltransferase [Acidimicrobiaceae bacterium]|nr:L-histidine Nalpha-methyltransferase [Acidimicrobiaceae bacterium]